MLAQDEELTTRDLVEMLNVPPDAIASVVEEAGRLLAAYGSGVTAAPER